MKCGESLVWMGVMFLMCTRATAGQQWLYIASPAKPAAIYGCQLDVDNGALGTLQVAAAEVDTGFLALHPTLNVLYAATSEQGPGYETDNGAVRAYAISAPGKLELLGKVPTADGGTTHIAVNRPGDFVAVCHYSGKGTCILGLEPNGHLGKARVSYEHTGKSITSRQERPHPHGVAFDQLGRGLCVADLGNDHVEVLDLGSVSSLQRISYWTAPPGAGPRHVAFHPNGKWLYCINELGNTIAVLAYNPVARSLQEIEIVTTLPPGFSGESYTAEVVVHPSGKFLYGSNRGHDSTVVYQIDSESGKLSCVQHEPTQGKHPRYVGLDATGRIYLAANMNSNSLVSFFVDSDSGKLTPTGHRLEVPRPMCVVPHVSP